MNRCAQPGCIQTDVKPYKRYIGHGLVLLCGSCFAALSAIGMSLTPVERRETALPVVTERRRIGRPAWLTHRLGRDETGSLVA